MSGQHDVDPGEPGCAHQAAPRGSPVRTPIDVDGLDGVETIEFDAALISTGSRPRIPDWCEPDGDRILTTRDCYPPKVFPKSVTVIGSGVTGVEFVHMFSSFGAEVTLVVSRQQVLPGKDPEVAAVLEEEFMRRGVKLLMGARAIGIERSDDGSSVIVDCDDGRLVESTHAVLAIGSVPNTAGIGLETAGVDVDAGGYVGINQHCVTNVRHIYAAGDISGKLPLSSVASMQGPQGRRARDGPAHARATATSTTTRPPRRSSPSPRSPTSVWPRPRRSVRAARSGSPRFRSRPPPRR